MKLTLIFMVAVLTFSGMSTADSFTLVSSVQAQEASQEKTSELLTEMQEAVRLHNDAMKGDPKAAEKANKLLKTIVKKAPENGLATAYLGSSYAIMAREAKSVVNKVRYSNRGIRYLDQALELAPEDFVVRFIRASVNSSLPGMFHRADKATEDMITLDRLYHLQTSGARAKMMIDIYQKLIARAPEAGPWNERLKLVRALANGE